MSVFSAMGIEAVAEGIDGFERNMGRMQSSIGKVANTTSDYELPLRSFYIALDAIAIAAVAAGAAIVTSLVGGLSLAIKEAAEAEVIWSKLGAALDSQQVINGFALTLEDAQKLAMRFRDLAGGSDEAIASIIEMGMRMGSVTSDQMPQFIQNTLDLAAVTGQDYPAAARIMALAMDDPTSAFMLLKRNGILFDESLQKQIKDEIAAGHSAKAMSLFMDRLSDSIGGRALTASKTFSARLEILKNHIGETFEEIGNKLLPILEPLIEKFSILADRVLPQLVDWFSNNLLPSIKNITDAVRKFFDKILSGDLKGAFADILPPEVLSAFDWLKQKWDDIKNAWNDNLKPALDDLKAWWDTNGGDITTAAGGIGKALGDIVTSAIVDGMKGLSDAIKTGLQWLTDHKEDIIKALDDIKNWLTTNKDAIKTGLEIFTGLVISQAAITGMASLATSIGAIAASAGPLAIVAGLLTVLEQVGEKQAKQKVPGIKPEELDIGTRLKLGFITALMSASQGAQALIDGIRAVLEKGFEEWGMLLIGYPVIIAVEWSRRVQEEISKTAGFVQLGIESGNWDLVKQGILNALSDAFGGAFQQIGVYFTTGGISINWSQLIQSISNSLTTALFGITIDWGMIMTHIFGGTEVLGGGGPGGEMTTIEIPGLVEQVKSALQTAMDESIASIKSTLKGWEDIGRGIIDGIISGIKSSIDKLKQAALDAIAALPDVVKKFLGMSSPSKVFQKIGKNIMAGLEKGINLGEDKSISALMEAMNIKNVPTAPVVGQGASYNTTSTQNILPGAQITNNTGFDIEAFAAIVRSA